MNVFDAIITKIRSRNKIQLTNRKLRIPNMIASMQQDATEEDRDILQHRIPDYHKMPRDADEENVSTIHRQATTIY